MDREVEKGISRVESDYVTEEILFMEYEDSRW